MERIDNCFCLIKEEDVLVQCEHIGNKNAHNFIIYKNKDFPDGEIHINTNYEKIGDKYKIFYHINIFGYDKILPKDYKKMTFSELENFAYNAFMDRAK